MMTTKRFPRLLALAAALFCLTACVGQKDDEEDIVDPGTNPGGTETGAPGIVLDFTATWCVNCPRMAQAIEEVVHERPGTVFPVSIHFHDDLAIPAGEALVTRYGIQSYPSLIVNLEASTLMTATSRELIIARLDATAEGRKAACTLEGQVSGSQLDVQVTAAEEGRYRLGVLLLEDGIVAPQTGGTDTYVHDNVLRGILSDGIDGDDLGSLNAGASAQKQYPLPTDISENRHLLVYTLDADKGQVNAVITLKL